MNTIRKIYRWIKRVCLYLYVLLFSVVTNRKIVISEIGTSGQDNFWQTSFRVTTSTPGKRVNEEFLRATEKDTKPYKIVLAIELAEDICKEQFLPPIATFIKVENDTIVVIIREN